MPSLLLLILWLAALVRTIVNLLTVPRLRVRALGRTPLVSVIVPARDEERTIGRTVAALLAQSYPALEVIVVNDRSADRTGGILRGFDDPRLVVVDGQEPPAGWLGKPAALHLGSTHAHGELLLFVDADVVYEPDAVAAAVAYLERRGLAMLSMLPRLEARGLWERVLMPNLALMAFMVLPLWLANRSRRPFFGMGGGPGNLVRREIYDAAGGHAALSDSVIDDVALGRLVRRAGGRTEMTLADHLVSVRMYHGLREVVNGFTKNSFSVFGRNYALTVALLVVSLVTSLAPYALALRNSYAASALVAMLLARVILYAALGYGFFNALLGHVPMTLVWSWILVRSMWRTGIRRQLEWRGRTYDASRTRFGAD